LYKDKNAAMCNKICCIQFKKIKFFISENTLT
jgi:hypothetical protein